MNLTMDSQTVLSASSLIRNAAFSNSASASNRLSVEFSPLEVLKPPRVVGLQTAELGAPPVIGRLRNPSPRHTAAVYLPSANNRSAVAADSDQECGRGGGVSDRYRLRGERHQGGRPLNRFSRHGADDQKRLSTRDGDIVSSEVVITGEVLALHAVAQLRDA